MKPFLLFMPQHLYRIMFGRTPHSRSFAGDDKAYLTRSGKEANSNCSAS
ncbi:hypothetical protein ACFSKU_21605 [Pontibacter silvestris]|uniref:Uncharacterized protein n=1 Tax=Pontibacter silvestris TaxID=2305183 RepID=A0ABW4X4A5_9BACT|nr:hypothetical protein [Pontibacter silvestris]MCC9138354.1 hypothetical protein [Pontibacter silvestris]